MTVAIDLNADLGEGAGTDLDLMAFITSANIACGAHAGGAASMAEAVRLCALDGVAVGAHPGYPDREGFGRRTMAMAASALERSIVEQVGALRAIAREARVDLHHVKPHGALYNLGAKDLVLAETIARAVRRSDARLTLVGLAGSRLLEAGRAGGLLVAAEAFADRAYEPDGSLRARDLPGALHTDPDMAAAQAVGIARDRRVRATDGSWLAVKADTLCVHGDTPGAARIASAVRRALEEAGIEVRAAGRSGRPGHR